MKSILLALALAASTSLAACSSSASQVEMKGGETDLAQLAGDWEGSYTGTDSGRSGPVSFSLQLGRHTADGTVLMGGATPLKIQFVAVDDGRISGKIDPYTDPACSCEVQTEFSGTLADGIISGSFTTKVAGQPVEQHGEWSVVRKSS
jgi:hypothetical protein